MADRIDYFHRQKLSEAELDEGFDKMEQADFDIMSDQLLHGVHSGGAVSEHFAVPDLTVDIAGPCAAYDQGGQRMFFSALQVLDMSIDENGASTAVGTPGNEKTLAIFLEFDRALSDPRLDGNNDTVFYQRAQSFSLNVAQSPEAALAASVPPALRTDQILLADVVIINAQTQILNADIDVARRENTFILTGTPNAFSVGRTKDALQAMLDVINGGATNFSYAGGPNWHDGTTNPATTAEGQFDKIVTDLIANAGADRVGVAASAGGIITAAGSIQDGMGELETNIQEALNVSALLDAASQSGGSDWAWSLATVPQWQSSIAGSSTLIIPVPLKSGFEIDKFGVVLSGGATRSSVWVLVRYWDNAGVLTRTVLGTISPTAANLNTDYSQTFTAHAVDAQLGYYAIEGTTVSEAAVARNLHSAYVRAARVA